MDKSGRTAFGVRLVAARKHAQLTQQKAAKAASMSQGTLAELEQEGQGSSYTTQLAAIYGVNVMWLATGKGTMLGGTSVSTIKAVETRPAPANVEAKPDIDESINLLSIYAKLERIDREEALAFMQNLIAQAIINKRVESSNDTK